MPYFLASCAKVFNSLWRMTNTRVGLPRKLRIRVLPLTRFSSLSAAIKKVARDNAPRPARLLTHSTPLTVMFVTMLVNCSAASPDWLMGLFLLFLLSCSYIVFFDLYGTNENVIA